MAAKTTRDFGNFWALLVKSCTRILLPLALVVGFILIIEGVPMGFDGKMEVTTLEGQTQMISQGPTGCHRADQAVRDEWRWLFRGEFFPSFGESDFPDEHDGMLVDINYPDGDGVRAGILLET